MPAPGDQHNASLANPFDEPQKRMSEYTAQQIATLQSRLEKQLGPEYLSSRSGPSGQKVHYIAAEKCIALANEVFGFNGWSSSIQNIQVDFVDEHPQTMKISLGLSVIVRVTLRDGTYHEDIGYGHIENCKGKAAAFEKAKKEGTTDALKRALRNFGNVLGNCIYDKDYLAKVTKIKPAPTKFDETRLHRHADYVKLEDKQREAREREEAVKKEMADAMGLEDLLDADFDEADFAMADEGHPDEVSLPQTETAAPNKTGNLAAPPQMQPPARPLGRSTSAGNLGNSRGPQTPNQAGPRPGFQAQGHNRPVPPNQPRAPTGPSAPVVPQQPSRAGNGTPPLNAVNNGNSGAEPVGFFSARAVPQEPDNGAATTLPVPAGAAAFNPKLESPSIRKTPGIDHTSSKPVSRSGQHVAPASSQSSQAPGSSGFTPVRPGTGAALGGAANSALGRRIGAPGGPASPLANRGSYRPPTMTKRPAPQESGAGRLPLAEVTNSTGASTGAGVQGPGVDASKRQRMA